MLSEGFVLKVDKEFATVGVKRQTACDTCRAQCGGHCDKASTVETVVKNTLGARVGDRVRLYSRTSTVLGYAALIFIVPIVMAALGYLLGYLIRLSTPLCAVLALTAFFLTYAVITLVYKNRKSYETIEMYDIIEAKNDRM